MESHKKYLIDLLTPNIHANLSPNTSMKWDKFIKTAFDQGVAAAIYPEIRNLPIPLPIKSVFEKTYETALVLNLSNLQVIEQLEQFCLKEHIEVMTLKGLSLLDQVYPQIGLRPMADIDLMIRPDDRSRFETLLNQWGYRRSAPLARLFNKGHSTIDLHTHALNIDRIAGRVLLFPKGMDPIWDHAQPWKPGFRFVKKPNKPDNLLLLSQHFMKHSFSKLIWLVDIYRLLQSFEKQDWQILPERTSFLKQEKCLAYALFLLKVCFDYRPPPGAKFVPGRLKLSRIEKTILKNSLWNPVQTRTGPLTALFCIPGIKNRTRFAWENLFPDKKVVNHEFKRYYAGKRIRLYPMRLVQALGMTTRQLIGFFITGFFKK
ncbi:MAG: hypothetical protein EHM45_05415 [Desulfobacteraceae bacterium]|nr:MAG: hypothetical protein EHM45_05415 [Desulfobacteraceae bacterium]